VLDCGLDRRLFAQLGKRLIPDSEVVAGVVAAVMRRPRYGTGGDLLPLLDLEVLCLRQWDDLLQVEQDLSTELIRDDAIAGDVRVVGAVQPEHGTGDLCAVVLRDQDDPYLVGQFVERLVDHPVGDLLTCLL
jgi:hypothetical protein